MANVLKFYGFEFSSSSQSNPELSGAQSCFKGVLTIANIIFLIFGAVLCGVGAYAMQTKAGGLAGQTLPNGIIALGVFIILVSFLGCVSAWKENRCFLGVYFAFLLLFCIILMAVGIAVYAQKDRATEYMREGWCAANYAVRMDVQSYFQCCGLDYYDDSTVRADGTFGSVGPACRPPGTPDSHIACPAGIDATNGQPCMTILASSFASSYIAAGASAIAFSVIMAAGMIIVCFLMSGIKEKKHLEEIRRLHRKLREAKEDPSLAGTMAQIRAGQAGAGVGAGLAMGSMGLHDESSYGYGEVDLGAAPPARGLYDNNNTTNEEGQEPLDNDVALEIGSNAEVEAQARESDRASADSFSARVNKKSKKSSSSTAAAVSEEKPTSAKKKSKKYQPEPEPEEVDEEAYGDQAHQHGYAPSHEADEYDE